MLIYNSDIRTLIGEMVEKRKIKKKVLKKFKSPALCLLLAVTSRCSVLLLSYRSASFQDQCFWGFVPNVLASIHYRLCKTKSFR